MSKFSPGDYVILTHKEYGADIFGSYGFLMGQDPGDLMWAVMTDHPYNCDPIRDDPFPPPGSVGEYVLPPGYQNSHVTWWWIVEENISPVDIRFDVHKARIDAYGCTHPPAPVAKGDAR